MRPLVWLLTATACGVFAYAASRSLPGALRRAGERVLARAAALAPLVLFVRPKSLAVWLAAAPFVAGAAVLAGFVFGTVWGIFAFVACVALAFSRLLKREEKLQAALRRQLPDAMEAIATSAAARSSLPSAMRDAAATAPSPLREVLADVLARYDRGVIFHEALAQSAAAVRNRELNLAFDIVSVCFRQGSPLDEVSRRLGSSLRSLDAFRAKIDNETSGTRMGMRIMLVVPIAVLVMMAGVEPQAVDQLLTSLLGKFLLVLAGLFLAVAWAWGRSILRSYV